MPGPQGKATPYLKNNKKIKIFKKPRPGVWI
jgi:hypothetical protein